MAEPNDTVRESNMHDIYAPQQTVGYGRESQPVEFQNSESTALKQQEVEEYDRSDFEGGDMTTNVKDRAKVSNRESISRISQAQRVLYNGFFCIHLFEFLWDFLNEFLSLFWAILLKYLLFKKNFFFAFYLFKEFYREFELEISEEPPDEEKARHVIEKKYVRKVEHENGTKVFIPFKMGDSIEEFQNLGEGIYVYFCFIKYFGLIFLFIGLLLLLPTILMILQDNNLNESKSNIFFRTRI